VKYPYKNTRKKTKTKKPIHSTTEFSDAKKKKLGAANKQKTLSSSSLYQQQKKSTQKKKTSNRHGIIKTLLFILLFFFFHLILCTTREHSKIVNVLKLSLLSIQNKNHHFIIRIKSFSFERQRKI